MNILEALNDPHLFRPWFEGRSWDLWRAVLKAAFGLKLSRRELELFRGVAGRDPPKGRVKELWAIGGRRAGKDSIASVIATFIVALGDYSALLPRRGRVCAVSRR